MNSDQGNNQKVVRFEKILHSRRKQDSIIAILKDIKRIALAIERRTCALCNTTKMCVNKTGLCTACYYKLTPREKNIADREARHKKIHLTVTDDRWDETNGH
jgi:hypothetical protein